MEKCLEEKYLDKKEYICELLIDLPKAFDTTSHGLLLAKVRATKTVNVRVWQDSTDGPLLLNLFINGLVLFLTEIMRSSYADDNKLLRKGKCIDKIKAILAKDFSIVTIGRVSSRNCY